MARIDLLPREYRQRRQERRLFLVVIAAGLAVLLVLGVVYFVQRGRIGTEEDRLREEQAETQALRAEVARLQQFAAIKQQAEERRATLAAALSGDVAWSKFLNDLSLIMPDNSWLTNATLSSAAGQAPNAQPSFGTVAFQGFVFDFPGLAGWLTRMSQVDGLTFVYLTNGARAEISARRVIQFGANANVTQALLSQRCQAGKPCP